MIDEVSSGSLGQQLSQRAYIPVSVPVPVFVRRSIGPVH
jgi:hypothetical protein